MKIRMLFIIGLAFAVVNTAGACTVKPASSNTTPAQETNANVPVNSEPAGTPAAAGAESQTTTPEALVAELYKQHDGKKSPFFQTKDRALVDKYFTKPLADLIWKDATTAKDEVGAIDGDPLYNAQDMEIKNFAIAKGVVKGDTATVAVTFTNFGDKKVINFDLKLGSSGWKIDNILYGDGGSLLEWLKETYPSKPATAGTEFEGTYQVGDTSCTVKAVKMAFEVRWSKGSGVEMFFAEGDNTFTSNPDKGQPNSFEFDDGSYNTGRFLRGDGKTFAVKRVK